MHKTHGGGKASSPTGVDQRRHQRQEGDTHDLNAQPDGAGRRRNRRSTRTRSSHSGIRERDAQGIFHLTGTVVPRELTLVDASGASYTISGASWFGGKSLDENTTLVFTETDHFVLHNASGGVAGKVQVVWHTSPGATFTFDKGNCEQPQG